MKRISGRYDHDLSLFSAHSGPFSRPLCSEKGAQNDGHGIFEDILFRKEG